MDWSALLKDECDKDSQTTMELLTQQTALTQRPQTQAQAQVRQPRQRPPHLRDEHAVAASTAAATTTSTAAAAAAAGSSLRQQPPVDVSTRNHGHHRSNINSTRSNNNNNNMMMMERRELPKTHTLRSRPLVVSSSFVHVPSARSSSSRNVGDDSVDDHDDDDDDDDDTLELAEGENWLLVMTENNNGTESTSAAFSLLDQTQEPSQPKESQNSNDDKSSRNNNKSSSDVFCSILSGVPVDREERFVCLDVDGKLLTVKDSRTTNLDDDDDDGINNNNNFIVSICRRNKHTLSLPSSWEPLPHRQLRQLQVGDCLVISRTTTSPPDDDASSATASSVLAVFEHCYDASITITTTQTTGTKTSTGALKDAPEDMEQDAHVSQLEDPEFTQGTATCGDDEDDKALTQPNDGNEEKPRPAVSSPPPAAVLTESKQQEQQQQQQQETVRRKNRRVEHEQDKDETQEELVEESNYQPVEYEYPPSPGGLGTSNVRNEHQEEHKDKKQCFHARLPAVAQQPEVDEEEPLATQPEDEDSDQDKSSSTRTNDTADNKPSASPMAGHDDNDVSMDDDEQEEETPSSSVKAGGSQSQASQCSAITDLHSIRTMVNDLVQAGKRRNSSESSPPPRQSPARGLLATDNNNSKTTSTPAKSSPSNSSAVGSDLLSPNLLEDSQDGNDDDDDDVDETQPVLESPSQAAALDPKASPMTDNVASTTDDAAAAAAAASVHPKVGEEVDDDGDDDDDATVDPQDSAQEHKAKDENSIQEPSSPPNEVSVANVENQVAANSKDDSPQSSNGKLARRESSASEKASHESPLQQDSPSSNKVPVSLPREVSKEVSVSSVEKPLAASKDDSPESFNSKASGRESVNSEKKSDDSPIDQEPPPLDGDSAIQMSQEESKQPPPPGAATHDPQMAQIAGDEDVARLPEQKNAEDDDDEATVDSAQLLTQENDDNSSVGEKVGMDPETANQKQSGTGSSPNEKASAPSKEVTLSSVEKRDAENANLSQSLNSKRARQESPASENKDSMDSTKAQDLPSLAGGATSPTPQDSKQPTACATDGESLCPTQEPLDQQAAQIANNTGDEDDGPDPLQAEDEDANGDDATPDPQQPQPSAKKKDDTIMTLEEARAESSNAEQQQEAGETSPSGKPNSEDATASRVKKRPARGVDLPQLLTSKRPRRGAAAPTIKKEVDETTKSQDSHPKDIKQPPESDNGNNSLDEDDNVAKRAKRAKPAAKQTRKTRGKRPGARSAPSSSVKPAPQQKPEDLPIARPTPLKGKQPVARPTPIEGKRPASRSVAFAEPERLPLPPTAKTPQTKTRRSTRSADKTGKAKKAIVKDEHQMAETKCIRVMTTGVDLSRQDKKTMKDLGMTFLDDIKDARTMTHLIIGDLKRTPKVMIAMSVTSNLLSYDWLVKCGKEGKLVPCQDYIIRDHRNYSFSQSIPRATSMRKQKVSVLSEYQVAVCKGVAGKKAPALKELKCMVEAAGGEWLGELSAKTKLVDSMIILTSEKATKTQEKQTKRFEENVHIKPITFLFDTLMAQQHDLEEP